MTALPVSRLDAWQADKNQAFAGHTLADLTDKGLTRLRDHHHNQHAHGLDPHAWVWVALIDAEKHRRNALINRRTGKDTPN